MFEEEELVEEKISLIECHCRDCDTKFFTNENNKFNNCIICNSIDIEKINNSVNKNIKIIPFNKTYRDAVSDYTKKVRFNPIVPLVFKSKKNYSTLQKVYVPVLITNISRVGDVEFIGGEEGNIADNKLLETRKYSILQKVKLNYIDVLLKITSKIDDDVFNVINKYDYFNTRDIDINYFDDSFYLYEDISLKEISNKGRTDIDRHSMKLIKDNVKHSLKKVKNDNTIISFENSRELLVPVYIMKINYKDKDYSYMMNGVSGKSYINLPISPIAIGIFGTIIALFAFLISFLIAYFL